MSANPANPEDGLTEAPVSGAPEHMLQIRIVPVGPLGVKEELDESKRLVVKYDPYMQVVNGMLGSSAGNMHRLGEILREAVDGSAQSEFAAAISAAAEEGENRGRNDVLATSSEQIAVLEANYNQAVENGKAIEADLQKAVNTQSQLGERIAELEADIEERKSVAAEAEKAIETHAANEKSLQDELEKAARRILELEKDLEKATEPTAKPAPAKADDAKAK